MVLLTEVDRKWFPVLGFWLHWISIFITSTINSLTGKDTGSLEVSWIRLPFHKVLVFKTIQLSKSVLSAMGNERVPSMELHSSRSLPVITGFWHRCFLASKALTFSPCKSSWSFFWQGIIIRILFRCIKYCFQDRWCSQKPSATRLIGKDVL